MIIFVVTDIDGMSNISEGTLKKLSLLHDVMFVNVSDALMTGYNAFDVPNGNAGRFAHPSVHSSLHFSSSYGSVWRV